MTHLMKAALIAATTTICTPAFADGIEAHDAYARASGPMARAGAAFLVLHNHSDTDITLIGAETQSAKKAELHTHIITDGIARMRQIEAGVTIPAGGEHVFKRGADHIMMMGLSEKFEDGKMLDIKLMFEKAEPVTIKVMVDNTRQPEDSHEMHKSE